MWIYLLLFLLVIISFLLKNATIEAYSHILWVKLPEEMIWELYTLLLSNFNLIVGTGSGSFSKYHHNYYISLT